MHNSHHLLTCAQLLRNIRCKNGAVTSEFDSRSHSQGSMHQALGFSNDLGFTYGLGFAYGLGFSYGLVFFCLFAASQK